MTGESIARIQSLDRGGDRGGRHGGEVRGALTTVGQVVILVLVLVIRGEVQSSFQTKMVGIGEIVARDGVSYHDLALYAF